MTENVVLVDENDMPVGEAGKMEAHEKGLLHRAFSVMFFDPENPRRMLMQQRAAGKYHCPLLWANACCSHPRPGETPQAGAQRRVREELGIDSPDLTAAGAFVYRAPVGDLVEHEYDHVFAAFLPKGEIPFNKSEVESVEWVDVESLLESDFNLKGRTMVPWLKPVVMHALSARLSPLHDDLLHTIRGMQ